MRSNPRAQAGFTLLEVLVALAILGIAVVTLIELASQSLRLVKRSGDYQQAVELADRLVRDTAASEESVDTGQDGTFTWERRITAIALPEEYTPKQNQNTQSRNPDAPQLFAVSVAVRWGANQSLEVATLLTPTTQDMTASTGGIQAPGPPTGAGPGQKAQPPSQLDKGSRTRGPGTRKDSR